MKRLVLSLLLLVSPAAFAAFDANGVTLGADEKAVLKGYPSAYCKPLEWKSAAADRRCDDARISFGGVEARITFYLKADRVEAFDVRFGTRDAARVVAFVKSRYGKPLAEQHETIDGREIQKMRWEQGNAHAVLVVQMDKRRGALSVSRGNFDEEIYRVR